MLNIPERQIDPPEDLHCEECGKRFYPSINQEWGENEPVLCYDCATFDG